jgi:glycosyltransferase involved in cell wall biosynthesis
MISPIHAPRFSIIVPAYNYAHYLPRALASVFAQSWTDCEVVVVDDGSTDDTAAIAGWWAERFGKRFSYVYQPNRGFAAARNHGIRASRGEFLLFLDADDELVPTALQQFQLLLAQDQTLEFIYGGRVQVSANGQAKRYPAPAHFRVNEQNFVRYLRGAFMDICAGSAAIKRQVFDRIMFQETTRVWEDIVFHAQLFALFQGTSLPEPVITIHRHADSWSHKHDLNMLFRTAELLFDPTVLPESFFRFRKLFVGQTKVTQFHAAYDSGAFQDAAGWFCKLVRQGPWSLLSWRIVRRYLRIVLRMTKR